MAAPDPQLAGYVQVVDGEPFYIVPVAVLTEHVTAVTAEANRWGKSEIAIDMRDSLSARANTFNAAASEYEHGLVEGLRTGASRAADHVARNSAPRSVIS